MKNALILFLIPIIIGCANIRHSENETNLNYIEYKKKLVHPGIKNFSLSGKISLFIKEKGLSGRIHWLSKDGYDNIEIYDPFNSIIAKISLTESSRKVLFVPSSSSQKEKSENVIKIIFGSSDNIFTLKKFLMSPPIELFENKNVSINYNEWIIRYSGIHDSIRKIPKTVEYSKDNISLKIFINDINT
jgi:outer membrane biogenesis lipoprotein LolB|tara:strand:+ start:509 stop:1072 length:564 start_codon:yes stop_codon:yes gene_type:complete